MRNVCGWALGLAALALLASGASAQEPQGWVEYGRKNFGRMAYRILARRPGGVVEVLDRWACMAETTESVECIYVTGETRRLVPGLLERGRKEDHAADVPAYPGHAKARLIATRQTLAYAVDCAGKRRRLLYREWFNVDGELLTRIRFLKESWDGIETIPELAAQICK